MVHENTRQLVPDGALDEGCRHCGIDAAGQPADDPGVADLRPDALDLLLKDVARGPVRLQLGAFEEEVLQDLLTVRGVLHLGVPLHAVEPLCFVGESGHVSAGRGGQDLKALGRLVDGVAVAHPRALVLGHALKDGAAVADGSGLRRPVLPEPGLGHPAAQCVRHGLEAVADSENRDTGFEQVSADTGGALGVDAGRAAGEDDGGGVLGQQLLGAVGMRNHFRIHIRFPDAAGDQLRVLGTVVNNQHGLVGRLGCSGSSHPSSLLCAMAGPHIEEPFQAAKQAAW
ncbi:hypothetical protein QFZ65_001283 [Arthrobacter sp. B3I9]|nr:hypothetical protein [Arthrobacter sp. B3I9]